LLCFSKCSWRSSTAVGVYKQQVIQYRGELYRVVGEAGCGAYNKIGKRSRPLNLPLFVGLKPLWGTCNDSILL